MQELTTQHKVALHQCLAAYLAVNQTFRVTTANDEVHVLTLLAHSTPKHFPHYGRGIHERTVYRIRDGIAVCGDERLEGFVGYSLLANRLYLPADNADTFRISSPVVAISHG